MQNSAERKALAAKFDDHAAKEGEILEEYRTLSATLGKGPVSTLVNHILTEEELHHLLLRVMAGYLREPPRPEDSVPQEANREELLRQTRKLQEHERETIKDCRGLRSELAGQGLDLLECLLDAMALDSEKHLRLLSGVEKMIRV